ncbi:SDR family oxidoreductase [Acinetobacter sp. WU_MDCI_Abxe161]|uniref:SDR family NAD(P)-dependent oxidoreductase n=1 Tax=Acinetobacter sp. WU_MDCI_Abxe161 TaxID=2850074 RepID=UPI0021CD4D8A|nr:SDR family oxidoreductase [Acinetobacter sp. WU_MDCI_Abxe161]MCU4503223.1 SDR family oxidoreductase [Acinetobacter sp. WU_MDCI_Abxe161]
MSAHLSLFKNSTALITGASSGIGKAYAQEFASLGIHLILTARSEQKLNDLADELRKKYKVNVEVIVLDLAQPNSAQSLFDEVQARKLSVEILINNAGFGKWTKFLDQSISIYQEMITLNISSVTSLCYLFLPHMLANKKGIMINISSTGAFQPLPYIAVYGASKSFVLQFTEALAGEYASSGVKFLAVCPGNTETNFTQVANADTSGMKSSTVEDVVSTTVRALEKNKATVVVGWNNYLTSQLPRILSRQKMINLVEGMLKTRVVEHS